MRLAVKTVSSRSAEELPKARFLPICAASRLGSRQAERRVRDPRLLGVPALTPAVSGAELSPERGRSAASS